MELKNHRTQLFYNALLNSGGIESKFENIIDECSRKNKKYKDPEFYPHKNLTKEDENKFEEHEWRRIEDQYPNNLFDNISPQSIQQGTLGDCYFIISLIYIANHIELVKSLFHPKSSLRYGCVLVYFLYLGEKIPVIIDTQIAYKNSNSDHPLFSYPRSTNDSCWFVLVEKAYAKLCGSYSSIESGTSHFGVHILTNFFSKSFSRIVDIIPTKSLEDEEEKATNLTTNDTVFNIITELIKKKAMIGTSIEKEKIENFDENIGLIPNHAYSIIDAKNSENKHFIKLRNPWGTGAYKGGYCHGSDKWTEQLKKDLNYSDEDDGSFWMLLENYFYYFNNLSYSLQSEENWKEENVFGKIEGYLDGRSPLSDSKSVGCIPQWSIKFSKKTIVRLTFNIAGPESFHGIYICKNGGNKINSIYYDTEMMRSVSNSMVNGLEYIVDDFSEPFTFFLTRVDEKDEPCYFRILIQSPDTDFTIKKFDDNFIDENWFCFSDTRLFSSSKICYWDPHESLSTCKQWYLRFPNLLNNKDEELRFRIFKNENEGPLYLLFARTSDKIRYINYNLNYEEYSICTKSNYEEISIPISFKDFYKYNDVFEYRESDSADYVFTFYRKKDSNIDKFKFSVLCQSKFEIGVMPEPDPINNCAYTIRGEPRLDFIDKKIINFNKSEFINQWCLIFNEEPITLFIEFINNIQPSEYKLILKEKPKKSEFQTKFEDEEIELEFIVDQKCSSDQIIWHIDKNINPYVLSIQNENDDGKNDFEFNIFGTKNFEMYRIAKNGYGMRVRKFDKSKCIEIDKQQISFPEVKFIKQPDDFHPIKSNNCTPYISKIYFNEEESYYYDYSSEYSKEYKEEINNNQQTTLNNNENNKNQSQNYVNNSFINNNNQIINNQTSNDNQNSYKYYYVSEYEEAQTDLQEKKNFSNEENEKKDDNNTNSHLNKIDTSQNDNKELSTKNGPQSDTVKNESKFNDQDAKEDNKEITFNINQNGNSNNYDIREQKMIDESKIFLFKKNIFYFNLYLISKAGKKLILAIIGFGILILKQKPFSKKMTRKKKIRFNEILAISHLSNDMIDIQYNKKSKKKQLLFHTANSILFISELMNHLYKTLNQFEMNKISFNNITLDESSSKCTSHSISLRLNSKTSLKKNQIHRDYLLLFSKALYSHSNSFFLAKVKKMKNIFPVLFPCISLDQNINQIDVVDPIYIFPFMEKFIECFNNINHLKIKGGDSKYFQALLSMLKNINSVSFHDYPIHKVDFIADLLEKYKIESIGFDSALNEKSFQSLIQIHSFSNLKYFRVSNLPKINFSACVNHFKQLFAISLPYCNLEIGNVFKVLESNQMENLQQLDLSGNKSDAQNNFSIPTNLQILYVNNIKWDTNQLKYFIDVCSNSNLTSLSINNIDFIDSIKLNEKWDFIFSNLPHQMTSICFLSWNSNEINEKFIAFLINSVSLTNISFNSCKCVHLNEIQRLLTQNANIENVSIQQICNLNHLQFKEFISNIPSMKSLNQINLSNNNFDDDCLDALSESLISSNIESIAFDNSNIGLFTDLLVFCKKLIKNKQLPINISYPIIDIQRWKINQNDIILLNKCINKLKKEFPIRETNSADPFQEVFFMKHTNNFNQFWTNENKIDQFTNNKDNIDMTSTKQLPEQQQEVNINIDQEDTKDQNNETKDEDDPSKLNKVSEENYSYEYYTESEISAVDQTRSQIITINTKTNKVHDISTNFKTTHTELAPISNKQNNKLKQENLANNYNEESMEFIQKNPYYQYINKISNNNDLISSKNYNNNSMSDLNHNITNKSMKSSIFQNNSLHLLRLTSSDSNLSYSAGLNDNINNIFSQDYFSDYNSESIDFL